MIKNNKAEILLSKTSNVNNALAMVKVNQTLWVDADNGMWDCEKPETIRETLKRNTILYIKHNVDGDIDEYCKYIACNRNGVARMGMFSLIDVVDYLSFNVLEFTKEFLDLYVEGLIK